MHLFFHEVSFKPSSYIDIKILAAGRFRHAIMSAKAVSIISKIGRDKAGGARRGQCSNREMRPYVNARSFLIIFLKSLKRRERE